MCAFPLLIVETRLQINRVKIEIISLVHENDHLSLSFCFVNHLYFRVEYAKLLGFYASDYLSFESQAVRTLNVTITVVFLTYYEVELLFIVGTVTNGLLA
jgi:hypothetical protein